MSFSPSGTPSRQAGGVYEEDRFLRTRQSEAGAVVGARNLLLGATLRLRKQHDHVQHLFLFRDGTGVLMVRHHLQLRSSSAAGEGAARWRGGTVTYMTGVFHDCRR